MLEELLKRIVAEKKAVGVPGNVILNFLKEYIQYLVLSFIYNHGIYKRAVFKGGSCVRICYNLPRLSEDIDFDYDPDELGEDFLLELQSFLEKEIKNKYFAALETKIQGTGRLYLKFPLLYGLGLAPKGESDKLYVKVEVNNEILPHAEFELTPVSQFGFNFIIRHYDLPTLMAGKINAILYRLWFKGQNNEIDVKGRDFYDLYWFLKNGVRPNMKLLKKTTGIASQRQLKAKITARIAALTSQKLSYDLQNFIADQEFVADFSKNYHKIIEKLWIGQ